MRIIAGEFRGRSLASPPPSVPTRPIIDRVKESLFNLLREHFDGAVVLDLFAGVGSLGLEAISRGAARCIFVEQQRSAAQVLRKNIDALGVADRCEVVVADALGPAVVARMRRPHIVFLDPPYALMENPDRVRPVFEQMSRLAAVMDPTGFLTLRTPWPLSYELVEQMPANLTGPETHRYNRMALHLYQPA